VLMRHHLELSDTPTAYHHTLHIQPLSFHEPKAGAPSCLCPELCAGQVGGYVTVHEGLTFSTVRNAGHMVPYVQPERAFWLFSRTIAGKSL